MLNIIGGVVGLVLGVIVARRRGGNRLDMAQYAAVFAIIGFLLGTLAMLLVPAPVRGLRKTSVRHAGKRRFPSKTHVLRPPRVRDVAHSLARPTALPCAHVPAVLRRPAPRTHPCEPSRIPRLHRGCVGGSGDL